MTFPASVADFKARFARDFVYGTGLETVRDVDITVAFGDADPMYNAGLWQTAEGVVAFLLASAHFLVMNLQAAGGLAAPVAAQGANSRGGGIVASKSVGQVSVNYAIPQAIVDDPILNQFMRTDYGQRYLQMVSPRLVGHVDVVSGWNDTGGPNGNL